MFSQFIKTNKFKIVIAIVLIIVITILLIMWKSSQSTKKYNWSSAEKSQFETKLKSVLVCKHADQKMFDAITDKFEKTWNFSTAMIHISETPISSAIQAVIASELTPDCLVEVLMSEHLGMPLKCAQCMVATAMKQSNNLTVVASQKLHDTTELKNLLLGCDCHGDVHPDVAH